MNDYGEYMIPLNDWLEVIANYREEEFERYCDYCDTCVADKYYGKDDDGGRYGGKNGGSGGDYGGNNVNNGNKYYNMGDLDDQYYFNRNNNGDDGDAGDDAAGRKLAGDDDAAAANGDDGANNKNNNNVNGYDCSYTKACKGYYDVCNNDQVEWAQFFNCKKVQYNNNYIYIGPHCKSDKKTIALAVFEDKYCTQYSGSQYDLQTLTDGLIQSDSLVEYYRTDCISCKESVSFCLLIVY